MKYDALWNTVLMVQLFLWEAKLFKVIRTELL